MPNKSSTILQSLPFHLLDKHIIEGKQDTHAIIDSEIVYTYGELFQQVMSFIASHEELLHLKQGSHILCLLEDGVELVVVIIALMRIGLVPCITNPNLPQNAYKSIMDISSPALVIGELTLKEKFLTDFVKWKIPYYFIGQIINEKSTCAYPLFETKPLDSAFGLFTSGTTGQPNLVIHRQQDPLITAENYVRHVLKLTSQDILFSTSKLFFAYGLNSLLFALMHGGTAILSLRINSLEDIWQTIIAYKPSIIFSVPTMYQRLLGSTLTPKKLDNVRLCISAGEHLPVSLLQMWQKKFGLPIFDGIGTTEVLSTFISNTQDDFRPGSTGKPITGFQIEIRDEQNLKTPSGKIGHLWIKGDTHPTEYYNNAKISAERFTDGWFNTYDMFSQDLDGFYYYHGRANDLIKCGGIWIYPHRIEEILNTHPLVLESVVVGRSQNGLMRPEAFVVLNKPADNEASLTEELKKICKERCSRYEYPHSIHFVKSIPQTATGKIQRYKFREVSYEPN